MNQLHLCPLAGYAMLGATRGVHTFRITVLFFALPVAMLGHMYPGKKRKSEVLVWMQQFRAMTDLRETLREGFKMRANESSRCITVLSSLMLIARPYRGFTVIISIYSSDIGDSYISNIYTYIAARLTAREQGGGTGLGDLSFRRRCSYMVTS